MNTHQMTVGESIIADPAAYAHRRGKELAAVSKTTKPSVKLHALADEIFSELMDSSLPATEVTRVTATFLITYCISLNSDKLATFEWFHTYCGQIIIDEAMRCTGENERTLPLSVYPEN